MGDGGGGAGAEEGVEDEVSGVRGNVESTLEYLLRLNCVECECAGRQGARGCFAYSIAFAISSTTFFASPNTIMVLSM